METMCGPESDACLEDTQCDCYQGCVREIECGSEIAGCASNCGVNPLDPPEVVADVQGCAMDNCAEQCPLPDFGC
jgi:hypothetical protein